MSLFPARNVNIIYLHSVTELIIYSAFIESIKSLGDVTSRAFANLTLLI